MSPCPRRGTSRRTARTPRHPGARQRGDGGGGRCALTAQRAEALLARAGPPLVRLAWLALFEQVQEASEGARHLEVVIRYLLQVGGRTVSQAAGRVLHSVLGAQHAEEWMRSYSEELIEQGRQQGLRQGLAQGLERGREQGRHRGRAEAVLQILAVRGIEASEEARQRILTCTDAALLDRWVHRALNATRLSDVLDDLTQ